ncbi:MAG: phosphoesterase [Desulfovibrio sp.]|jgi:nanoRNase/pAp phosphatase (c-di-AMP/oligoRNAs hydrolase)|nr:phosphoesterase [Desulfovibrio sp.]
MSYFRRIHSLEKFSEILSREQRWLIVINADPDAMASALALKNILSRRVQVAEIAKINTLSRPDNLAMVRYTRLRMTDFAECPPGAFDHYALTDSQPDHHPIFKRIPFSLLLDHHPLSAAPPDIPFVEIRPEYGATSTLLTEFLYNLNIRPGKYLATALQFGIKTDTDNFGRHFCDVDMRAFHYLSRFSDSNLLARISRSEFHERRLNFFARACTGLRSVGVSGRHAHVGKVDTPDILVNIADFFMRVYEIRWTAVSGRYGDMLVIIFRGDGVSRDMGALAVRAFGELGSAGGHKAMARAEIPATAAGTEEAAAFIRKRLFRHGPRQTKQSPARGTAASKGNQSVLP